MTIQKHRERGASLIMFSLFTVMVVIPILGLGIDGSRVFWAKAKLSAAVDAAALAAGRNPGTDAQTDVIVANYVKANFPVGWLGSSFVAGPTGNTVISNGTRRVTVSASVSVPTMFMGLLGHPYSIVAASAASSKRDANIILVLDRSGSMSDPSEMVDGVTACDLMKSSAQSFVNLFAENSARMGMVTFSTGSNLDYPFSYTFKSNTKNLNYYISHIVCQNGTSSAMALNTAYKAIQTLPASAQASNGVLNVIVFFTDGAPNGITADFPVRLLPDDRYDPRNTGTLQTPLALGLKPLLCQLNMVVNNLLTPSLTGIPGVLAQASKPTGFEATGATQGLSQMTVPPLTSRSCPGLSVCNTTITPVPAANCTFTTKNSSYARTDIAYIPLHDHYWNLTSGYMTQPSDWVSTGPYANLGFRTDTPLAVTDASFNAADDQARTIRNDIHGYAPMIYTIGLATNNVTSTFLERVANDPRSTAYDSSKAAGRFVFASDASQLNSAFQSVAAQLLRLSQ